MEAAGLAFSVAQSLFAALQCSELKNLLSLWGYQSELENLEKTVGTIQAVLCDVDAKQAQGFELTNTELDFIENLKEIVYDADDLLDEFATQAAQRQQLQNTQKVRRLLSRLKKFGVVYKISREVKAIRKKLDGFASDVGKFSFKVDYQALRRWREETCSYACGENVIGREDDRMRIIETLLDPTCEEDVSILTIVGMGGLGKTALARLVYNDEAISNEFPQRLWACIGDQNQKHLDVKGILGNILNLTIDGGRDTYGHGLEQVVKRLREELGKNKFFLVLDDVWTEEHREWDRLKQCLIGAGQKGNKILVTTRSKETAKAISSNAIYEIRGLSEENSWHLFEMVVGREQANHHDFADIGRKLVKKCANVPLAIKVVGSLLCGQDKNKWLSFQNCRLTDISNDGKGIMSILKFSYHHLSPSLKCCFSYCALYPKDFHIEKERLISLWIAQGFVKPFRGGQSIEDAGEEHFLLLLRRCFFQEVEEKDVGKVTFKIHDLIHDMAQEVAGNEVFITNSATNTMDKRVRHLYDNDLSGRTKDLVTTTKLRTYLQSYNIGLSIVKTKFPLGALLAKWRSLRALDLHSLGIECLPNAIGELLHLRFLDLSRNRHLKMLPDSITNLINLQTLNLDSCFALEELPEGFSKLVNLRSLCVPCFTKGSTCRELSGLRYMPLGMEKLTCLNRLNKFVVGQRKSSLKQDKFVGVEGPRFPSSLKGHLDIWITNNYKYVKENGGKGGHLSNTRHLNSVSICWPQYIFDSWSANAYTEMHCLLLEDLQPHSNLKELKIRHYPGVRVPGWAREDSLTISLPNLVKVVLSGCGGLQEVPCLSQLRCLKSLQLSHLKNLEFMENTTSGTSNGTCSLRGVQKIESSAFFPSLEELHLAFLPKLKGWWRRLGMSMPMSGSGMGDDEIVNSISSIQTAGLHQLPSFPRLSKLEIRYCGELTTIPLCPTVENLKMCCVNESLRIMIKEEEYQEEEGHTDDSRHLTYVARMRTLETTNVSHLKTLPIGAFQCLTQMELMFDERVESLSEAAEVFRSCASSLRSLKVGWCENLRVVSEGLGFLTAVELLELTNLPKLTFDETDEEEGEKDRANSISKPWRCLGKCLRSLKLDRLEKVNLPKGLRYLTSLQCLDISDLPLKDLPEWIGSLSSLQSLTIYSCKDLESLPEALRKLACLKKLRIICCNPILKRRCKSPDGEDWPKIQHIPDIYIW